MVLGAGGKSIAWRRSRTGRSRVARQASARIPKALFFPGPAGPIAGRALLPKVGSLRSARPSARLPGHRPRIRPAGRTPRR